jgi:hypothetical protein
MADQYFIFQDSRLSAAAGVVTDDTLEGILDSMKSSRSELFTHLRMTVRQGRLKLHGRRGDGNRRKNIPEAGRGRKMAVSRQRF